MNPALVSTRHGGIHFAPTEHIGFGAQPELPSDHAGTPSWSQVPIQAAKRPVRNEYAAHVLTTGKTPRTSSEAKTRVELSLTLGNPKKVALTPGNLAFLHASYAQAGGLAEQRWSDVKLSGESEVIPGGLLSVWSGVTDALIDTIDPNAPGFVPRLVKAGERYKNTALQLHEPGANKLALLEEMQHDKNYIDAHVLMVLAGVAAIGGRFSPWVPALSLGMAVDHLIVSHENFVNRTKDPAIKEMYTFWPRDLPFGIQLKPQ